MVVCIGDHLQLCHGWSVAAQLCTAPLCSSTHVGQVPQFSTLGNESGAVITPGTATLCPNVKDFTVCPNE